MFKDLIVIELASVLAGPAVGMFFAELGAKVIKVENERTGGDVTRRWKVPEENPDALHSAYWCCVNWQKEVHFIDLQTEAGKSFIHSLVKTADVVISNFKPSSARAMEMDSETLRNINPALIYAQLTGFGDEDETPAFDVVLQAEAGFLYMTGEPGREPVKMPVALIDLLAAHQLKEGILTALIHRMKTGKGSFVKTSLFEAAVASLANQATNWLMAGHIPQRLGAKHPNIAPYGDIFYTKDEKALVLAVGTEKQFESLCEITGLTSLPSDRRFLSNSLRVKNRQELIELLRPAIQKFTREELLHLLKSAGVPAGSIRNMQEVFELPMAKDMILEERLADGTLSKRVKTVTFKLDN